MQGNTFGDFISKIFDVYEGFFRDAEVAAVATEAVLNSFFYEAATAASTTQRPATTRSSAG